MVFIIANRTHTLLAKKTDILTHVVCAPGVSVCSADLQVAPGF